MAIFYYIAELKWLIVTYYFLLLPNSEDSVYTTNYQATLSQ